jgi:transposase
VNVLKPHKRNDVLALARANISFREIERRLGVRRETVSRYAREAGLCKVDSKAATGEEVATGSAEQNRPEETTRPPAFLEPLPAKVPKKAQSACGPYQKWIEDQILLGRNAMAIYQDLVERFGFQHRYNSVKRFVRCLKRKAPEVYDVLEFLPGEEAQVDYGQGALTLHPKTGRYRRPRLFIMTLRYSRRSFRKVVWESSKVIWARLHEEAFRYFGGCPQYVVLDNLKEGVLKPDIYKPLLNATYAAMLAHYGAIADPARVEDPDRKGTVEKAVDHTQSTCLKGLKFDSIEEQNEKLMSWEARWASKRVHGRAKRQVEEMFQEEKPHLKTLPPLGFRYFEQEERTVWSDTLVEVKGSYYHAPPEFIGHRIPIRIFESTIEVLNPRTLEVVRRHVRSHRKGKFNIDDKDRVFNPCRDTYRLFQQADRIGEATGKLARLIFADEGRPGQRRVMALVALDRKFPREEIERASALVLSRGGRRGYFVKRLLQSGGAAERTVEAAHPVPALVQSHKLIRDVEDYGAFFSQHAR